MFYSENMSPSDNIPHTNIPSEHRMRNTPIFLSWLLSLWLLFYVKLMFWICNYYCSDVFLKNLFVLCLTSQSDSGQVMKYIYVHDCFDVCSWVQTHLVRVWECMWVHARVRVCVCVFAAAVQGCSKHAGKPVTANQARENHPSAQRREPTIPHFVCLCSFLHYSLHLFFSVSHSFIKALLYSRFYSRVKFWLEELKT